MFQCHIRCTITAVIQTPSCLPSLRATCRYLFQKLFQVLLIDSRNRDDALLLSSVHGVVVVVPPGVLNLELYSQHGAFTDKKVNLDSFGFECVLRIGLA